MRQTSFLSEQPSLTKKTLTDGKAIVWHIFIDGASRNNPGPSGAGVYISSAEEVICKKGFYLKHKTNNQAEYLSLLLALFIANEEAKQREVPTIHFDITSDSELLVKQMKGSYRVKNPEIRKIKRVIDRFLTNKPYTIKHVLREQNKIADKLANLGIDKKKQPPAHFITLLQDNDITY